MMKEKPTIHFGEYPDDYFDFIVAVRMLMNMHRGGAQDEAIGVASWVF